MSDARLIKGLGYLPPDSEGTMEMRIFSFIGLDHPQVSGSRPQIRILRPDGS
jgi:hypothetical protein